MRFKRGDIIENLWASEDNPRRKVIFLYNKGFRHPCYLWFGNSIQITFTTEDAIRRWEDDAEHYKVIGHCDIEQFIIDYLDKNIVMSIEEKAREYEANIGWQEYAPNETEKAFKAGSERMLEKAEKWLFENLPYTIDAKTFTTRREILRDFRKAMEKELCNIEK